MDEAEAVSRALLLDTATVAAAAGKVDEHSVGYISASVSYNQVSRGVDPKIAILVVSICGLESKTYAVLCRATQHVLLQSSGSANFGALQQFCVKLRPPAPFLQAAPIQCNQSDQQFADKQVPTGIRVYDRRVLFFVLQVCILLSLTDSACNLWQAQTCYNKAVTEPSAQGPYDFRLLQGASSHPDFARGLTAIVALVVAAVPVATPDGTVIDHPFGGANDGSLGKHWKPFASAALAQEKFVVHTRALLLSARATAAPRVAESVEEFNKEIERCRNSPLGKRQTRRKLSKLRESAWKSLRSSTVRTLLL